VTNKSGQASGFVVDNGQVVKDKVGGKGSITRFSSSYSCPFSNCSFSFTALLIGMS
jgi:hypothetical protein